MLMRRLDESQYFNLQLLVTGTHLSDEFGRTIDEIVLDGFRVDETVEMLTSSDSAVGTINSMGLGLIGFAQALSRLDSDFIVVLGDRFEMLAVALSAYVLRIPVVHLHGGELSEGALDDGFRHAITKFSSFHFVAAQQYRDRVIQLGEQPSTVFNVGALGVDATHEATLLSKEELEKSLGITIKDKSLLVTFHPATYSSSDAKTQIKQLLAALQEFPEYDLIFTAPNADARGRAVLSAIKEYTDRQTNAHLFTSLGSIRYLSTVACVQGVIGNSSSGLIEVPAMKKGTVNIGSRQQGRLMASSVICCGEDKSSIVEAITELLSAAFQNSLSTIQNPYGYGGAAEAIIQRLREIRKGYVNPKIFHDLRLPPL